MVQVMALRVQPIGEHEYDGLATLLAENNLLAGDLEGPNKRFYVFIDDSGWRVGVGGLEVYGSIGLLRSFLTTSSHRGQGLGGQMLEELMRRARDLGIETVYLFTQDAEGFFAKHGFGPADRETAPAVLKDSVQFVRHCEDAVFMVRHLP
jgi:amino-acid N-acetyltransferase